MTYAEVILAGYPQADDAMIEHILWERTPYPMGKVTARSLYQAASRIRRATNNGVQLCDFCDNKAADLGAIALRGAVSGNHCTSLPTRSAHASRSLRR